MLKGTMLVWANSKTVDIKDTITISSVTTSLVVNINRWTKALITWAVVLVAGIRISSKTPNTNLVETELTTKATTRIRRTKVRGPPCLKTRIKRHSTAMAAPVSSTTSKDRDPSIATTNLVNSIQTKRGKTITSGSKTSPKFSNKLIFNPSSKPTTSQTCQMLLMLKVKCCLWVSP